MARVAKLALSPPVGDQPAIANPAPAVSGVVAVGSVTTKPAGRLNLAGKLLRQKTATLFRHFPAALACDEEGIHQLRVWGRRLRVALRLLASKPHGKRANRAQQLLQLMTQTAGAGRDLDVLLEIFVDHLKQAPRPSPEQRQLRRRLASARRRSRVRMVQGLLDLDIARLRADLAKIAAQAGSDTMAIEQKFLTLCDRESCKLCDGFAALGAVLDVEALHGLRRRARRMRYAVEVHGEVFAGASAATKPWKTLQDLIGVVHDHHVLSEWFDSQSQADRKRGNPALAAVASAEAAWAREAVHRLHAEFLAAKPLALIEEGLRAAGYVPPARAQ